MKKKHEVKIDITIFDTKDKVWDVLLTQFGNVNIFNPLIIDSYSLNDKIGEGSERFCQIDEKRYVKERVFDVVEGRSFKIDIYEGGLPMVSNVIGALDIKDVGRGRTRVDMTFSLNISPNILAPVMKPMLTKQFKPLLVGLKYYMETGKEVTKENIKSIMEGYDALGDEVNYKIMQVNSAA